MKWTVYCHTHVESGRRYVGLTKNRWQLRWAQHCSKSVHAKNRKNHFYNAIRTYGKDAFSHVVLMQLDSVEFANQWEEFWIDFLDTRNPERGFNLARGGQHVPHPVRNPWDRPEYREKCVQASRRRASDPGFRAAMSKASLEKWTRPGAREHASKVAKKLEFTAGHREKLRQSRIGRPIPEEVRAKISASQVGKPRDPESIAKSARSRTGMRQSESARASVSAAQRGRKHTAEHVRKVADALRARPKPTHCKAGHPLDDAYLVSGRRFCRKCQSERSARYHAGRRHL